MTETANPAAEAGGCAPENMTANVAYFSMEIGIDTKMPTYSGGLGVLAADMIRSAADLKVPLVAVTLLYKKGYFNQKIDGDGVQTEFPVEWDPGRFMRLLPDRISVTIENRTVSVGAWVYAVTGISGYCVPILFLDTDFDGNGAYDRGLANYLYGGDEKYRFSQEIILGIGGVRMLRKLGYEEIVRYHMNEGHSSLLTLELLKEKKDADGFGWDINGVRKKCVFTTHTPVPAGMDQFSYGLAEQLLGGYIPMDLLKSIGGTDRLNMTMLALNLSHYENGVAKEHGIVSSGLFPGYHIDAITNGVHSATWVCECFSELYEKYMPGWRNDPFSLRHALSIPNKEVWDTHQGAKETLIEYVKSNTGIALDPGVLTIGFARRATAYKRADLVFYDTKRLVDISKRAGKIQFVFAGKAHPMDRDGKDIIRKVVSISRALSRDIKIVYLENYSQELAKLLISGVDLWLNTPQKPREASGTSGMKAAHNGVPSFSILDGWWIEGCVDGITGWAIGSAFDAENDNRKDSDSLYGILEKTIIPMFYNNRRKWINIMRHTIAINASFFNTHRMVQQYVLKAYME